MQEGRSPTPATTAEEAMTSPRDCRTEAAVRPGGAIGMEGALPGVAGGEVSEMTEEGEAWAAAVPPVRTGALLSSYDSSLSADHLAASLLCKFTFLVPASPPFH